MECWGLALYKHRSCQLLVTVQNAFYKIYCYVPPKVFREGHLQETGVETRELCIYDSFIICILIIVMSVVVTSFAL